MSLSRWIIWVGTFDIPDVSLSFFYIYLLWPQVPLRLLGSLGLYILIGLMTGHNILDTHTMYLLVIILSRHSFKNPERLEKL